MEDALTYNLQKVNWHFFGTLTFKSARVPEGVRLSMFFAVLRKLCKRFRVYFPKAVWVLRQEDGEITGRRHFHFLFRGLPPEAVNPGTCFFIMSSWEKIGGGMARVRQYDLTQSGVEYVTKCLHLETGANLYETTKFSKASSSVLLSNSFSEPANLDRIAVG